MQNLIRFFVQYGNILLFILLELFCFSIIINQNKSQKDIYLNSKNLFTGFFYTKIQDFNDFIHLTDIADSLAIENASLRAELRNAKFKMGTVKTEHVDSVYIQNYSYISARVISNSIHLQNNRIIIDQGLDNGIEAGMGVISNLGVVGIVTKASPKFSLILPILHSQSKVSVAIKRNEYFGTLVWSGRGSRDFKMINLPKHADVVVGDTIITSGYSTIFPKGIEIGRVDQVKEINGSNEYDIDTRIHVDLSKISRVYVIDNLFREEFDNLLNSTYE